MKLFFLGLTLMSLFRALFGGNNEPEEHEEEVSLMPSVLGAFLAGCAIGALGTALATPTSGAKLRKNLRGKVRSAKKQVEHNADNVRKAIERKRDDVKSAGRGLLDRLSA